MRRNHIWKTVLSVTDLDGNPRTGYPYDGLSGFPWRVMLETGEEMLLTFPDDLIPRLTTSPVREHSFDEDTFTHVVKTKHSIYTLKDYFDAAARKRATAHFYMLSPIGKRYGQPNPDPQKHLLAYGIYRTKIRECDLPDWYISGYMYKAHGYMSAKGVKHLVYKPNYLFNHLYKDDVLFISYDREITPVTTELGWDWYDGYDELLSGPVIVEFTKAVGEYSHIDVTDILAEMKKKEEWYRENYE